MWNLRNCWFYRASHQPLCDQQIRSLRKALSDFGGNRSKPPVNVLFKGVSFISADSSLGTMSNGQTRRAWPL